MWNMFYYFKKYILLFQGTREARKKFGPNLNFDKVLTVFGTNIEKMCYPSSGK